jgi:hypothetical protein
MASYGSRSHLHAPVQQAMAIPSCYLFEQVLPDVLKRVAVAGEPAGLPSDDAVPAVEHRLSCEQRAHPARPRFPVADVLGAPEIEYFPWHWNRALANGWVKLMSSPSVRR